MHLDEVSEYVPEVLSVREELTRMLGGWQVVFVCGEVPVELVKGRAPVGITVPTGQHCVVSAVRAQVQHCIEGF